MTNVFNVFVVMQIFNMVNCRFINDETKILKGILRNRILIIIMLLILGGQVLIVQFGGEYF